MSFARPLLLPAPSIDPVTLVESTTMRYQTTPAPASDATPVQPQALSAPSVASAASDWLVCPGCLQVAGANPVSTKCCSQLYCWECLLRAPTCRCGAALRAEECRPIDQTAAVRITHIPSILFFCVVLHCVALRCIAVALPLLTMVRLV